jgi:SAM-dependent methyltransferase
MLFRESTKVQEDQSSVRKNVRVESSSTKFNSIYCQLKMEEKQENALDQSAHLLGNYHKYYSFHSARSRTDLLSEKAEVFFQIWKQMKSPGSFHILDIGCNEGDLTIAVYQMLREQLPAEVEMKAIGIDLDPHLIDLATSKLTAENQDHIEFYTVNCMIEEDMETWKRTIGDITFALISVFSTTMWIHINHGDDGLRQFFLRLRSLQDTSIGVLLVEPQPGRCYTNAAKRCRKLGLSIPPYLQTIDKKAVQQTITTIIRDDVGLRNIYSFGEEDWGRSILLFHDFESL